MSCIIKRLLTITVPVTNATDIRLINNNEDVTGCCMFSWSTDSVCWTEWCTMERYLELRNSIDGDYYMRLLVMTPFTMLAINGAASDCYSICIYNENIYLTDLCATNTIDFYAGLDCAINMYNQLSNLICCMIGIPCYYFRVLPDDDTHDYSFKEYVLHHVEDVKYIKLVVQDGQMPSSKPMMTDFDFTWDMDWEVEIGKQMFATAFGDTAFPKQRDIIYIPMMKRMYEVNSAYDEKQDGFMWRPVTWRLGLIKYNDKTNVDKADFSDVIDSWIVNKYDGMHNAELLEQEEQTGVTQIQVPQYKANNLYSVFMSDAERAYMTRDTMEGIMEFQRNSRSFVVSRNAYRGGSGQVQYQSQWCGDDGTLMCMIQAGGEGRLIEAGNIHLDVTADSVTFNGMTAPLTAGNTYIVIARWSRPNFSSSLTVLEHKLTSDAPVPSYMTRPEMYEFAEYYTDVTGYSNDFMTADPVPVVLTPVTTVTNIRMYTRCLNNNEAYSEAMKYTTTAESSILNDVARPIESTLGFNIR